LLRPSWPRPFGADAPEIPLAGSKAASRRRQMRTSCRAAAPHTRWHSNLRMAGSKPDYGANVMLLILRIGQSPQLPSVPPSCHQGSICPPPSGRSIAPDDPSPCLYAIPEPAPGPVREAAFGPRPNGIPRAQRMKDGFPTRPCRRPFGPARSSPQSGTYDFRCGLQPLRSLPSDETECDDP
jgi:hypothetical protein